MQRIFLLLPEDLKNVSLFFFFFGVCIFHFLFAHKKFYSSGVHEIHSKMCNWQFKRKTFWTFCPPDEKKKSNRSHQRATEDAMLTLTVTVVSRGSLVEV